MMLWSYEKTIKKITNHCDIEVVYQVYKYLKNTLEELGAFKLFEGCDK